MKTKFYELIISQTEIPTITRIFVDHIFEKMECEAIDKWAMDNFNKYRATSDINDYFYKKAIFYTKSNRDSCSAAMIDKFDNINDAPVDLRNYLVEFSNATEVVICHRKHPVKENIRQIVAIQGKTDRLIHWID